MSDLLVIGCNGQVATALAGLGQRTALNIMCLGRDAFDLSRPAEIGDAIARLKPSAVINAAAYTQVDKAESEPDAAYLLNRDGPAALAMACARLDAPLVHISTDYVFDGLGGAPYREDAAKVPVNLYGLSKSEGEDAVLAAAPRVIVVRASWVYAATGSNFVKTMLRLAETREELGVIDDQRGKPTYADDLAEVCLTLATRMLDGEPKAQGMFHYAGAGEATWADFAEGIFAEAERRGRKAARVRRIGTQDYPTPARRPGDTRMDTGKITRDLGVTPRDWRESLSDCFDALEKNQPA